MSKATVQSTASRRKGEAKKPQGLFSAKNAYLVTYNILSALGWSYILYTTVLHVLEFTPAPPIQTSASATASTAFQRLLSRVPLTLRNATPLTQVKAKVYESIPPAVLPLLNRAKTLYSVGGPAVALVQSFAVLEVLHVLMGLVRSPLATTGMQVASRLFLVWGIVERYPETQSNPLYASMVFAWSFTEVIRYSFYAANIVGYEPYILTYLRYTTFYVLYPLGASSEAFLVFSTLPPLSTKSFFSKSWGVEDYAHAFLFSIWWPGLFVMISYMIRQRAKVLGGVSPKLHKAKTM